MKKIPIDTVRANQYRTVFIILCFQSKINTILKWLYIYPLWCIWYISITSFADANLGEYFCIFLYNPFFVYPQRNAMKVVSSIRYKATSSPSRRLETFHLSGWILPAIMGWPWWAGGQRSSGIMVRSVMARVSSSKDGGNNSGQYWNGLCRWFVWDVFTCGWLCP